MTSISVPDDSEPLEGYHLSDYDYDLPRHLIAQFPLPDRSSARMMVLDRNRQSLSHHHFYEFPELLQTGDHVVMNNTRVSPARLLGHRKGHTGVVEVLLLYPTAENPEHWSALMRPARKLKPGTIIELNRHPATLTVVEQRNRGEGVVSVQLAGLESVDALMAIAGEMPIPPYLERKAVEADKETYQTVYAKVKGSQAAPTAGLHFTPEVLEALAKKGIHRSEVTLTVGLGTFQEVTAENITEHPMHAEQYSLSPEAARDIEATRYRATEASSNQNRIIAIGTTSAKTLETVARNHNGAILAENGWSDLFIYPGFQWEVVGGLLTNFHLPKTTLMMMISAFAGREFILAAYEEAVKEQYRFYSYGDCMLIL